MNKSGGPNLPNFVIFSFSVLLTAFLTDIFLDFINPSSKS